MVGSRLLTMLESAHVLGVLYVLDGQGVGALVLSCLVCALEHVGEVCLRRTLQRLYRWAAPSERARGVVLGEFSNDFGECGERYLQLRGVAELSDLAFGHCAASPSSFWPLGLSFWSVASLCALCPRCWLCCALRQGCHGLPATLAGLLVLLHIYEHTRVSM